MFFEKKKSEFGSDRSSSYIHLNLFAWQLSDVGYFPKSIGYIGTVSFFEYKWHA